MEITEMEKIDYILREGAKNTIGFLNFIKEERFILDNQYICRLYHS